MTPYILRYVRETSCGVWSPSTPADPHETEDDKGRNLG